MDFGGYDREYYMRATGNANLMTFTYVSLTFGRLCGSWQTKQKSLEVVPMMTLKL